MLGARLADRLVWAGVKAVYSGMIGGRNDWEIAETFFNSVTRRVFATVGVDGNIEFVDSDFEAPPEGGELLCRSYQCSGDAPALVQELGRDQGLEAPFEDVGRDAALAAGRLGDHLRSLEVADGV